MENKYLPVDPAMEPDKSKPRLVRTRICQYNILSNCDVSAPQVQAEAAGAAPDCGRHGSTYGCLRQQLATGECG